MSPNFCPPPADRILVYTCTPYSKDTKVNETFNDQRQFLNQQSRKHFATHARHATSKCIYLALPDKDYNSTASYSLISTLSALALS
jgi:hypothetical protein